MSRREIRTTIHPRRDHARSESGYVATCDEIAAVTQGETLDELTANLGEALALHLEGEDLAALACAAQPA